MKILNEKKLQEGMADLKPNILINSRYFIPELIKQIKDNGFEIDTVNKKKLFGEASNSMSFYRTRIIVGDNTIEVLHHLEGITHVTHDIAYVLSSVAYAFDDVYAQELKKYTKAQDVIQIIIDKMIQYKK